MRARKTVSRSKKAIQLRKITSMSTRIKKTKVFQSGNSRAVRLPKEIQLSLGPVNIYQIGNRVIICKAPITIGDLWDLVPKLPPGVQLEMPDDDLPPERDVSWD